MAKFTETTLSNKEAREKYGGHPRIFVVLPTPKSSGKPAASKPGIPDWAVKQIGKEMQAGLKSQARMK